MRRKTAFLPNLEDVSDVKPEINLWLAFLSIVVWPIVLAGFKVNRKAAVVDFVTSNSHISISVKKISNTAILCIDFEIIQPNCLGAGAQVDP